MDYEIYYKFTQDRTYCIHFLNKKRLNAEEIRNMFSLYGNVLSMTWNKDINGFYFIKYQTIQETLYCLESLLKSEDIRILPQKNKISKQRPLKRQFKHIDRKPTRIQHELT